MQKDVLNAIADTNRREILRMLSVNSLSVNSVAEKFKISRPAVSKHVKILKECGLISIKKKGREHICEPKFDKLKEVSSWVEKSRTFWNEKLDDLERFLAEN